MLDRTLINHTTTGRHKIDIKIEKWMDGGGLHFGLEYPTIIKHLFPNKVFSHCLDWCSGPGTIGFELLSHDLIEKLTLMDINGEVIRAAKNIIKNNNLENVSTIVTGSCKFLPSKVKYDLVVSNPPHFSDLKQMSIYNGSLVSVTPDARRKAQDKDWKIHEDFFINIKDKLTDDAIIVLQENAQGSCLEDFSEMIAINGYDILDCLTYQIPLVYYIVLKMKK